MTLKTFLLPLGFSCALFGTALTLGISCGDSKSSGGTGGAATGGDTATGGGGGSAATGGAGGSAPTATPIAISGVASPFPGDPETDFTSLALAIADPLEVLAGKPALATMAPFDSSAAVCPGEACGVPYTFASVTVNPATSILGLLALLQDLRPTAGAPAKWVRTGTGIANSAQLAAAVASGTLANRPVFAVSTKLEASLSTFAATVTTAAGVSAGLTGAAGELAAKGFVIAMILANGTPKPTPVAGATFSPPDAGKGKFVVLYPTPDFSGVGTSTSASGIVVIFPVGSAATATVGPWGVTPPADSTTTWPSQIVGVQANGAVVLLNVSNN